MSLSLVRDISQCAAPEEKRRRHALGSLGLACLGAHSTLGGGYERGLGGLPREIRKGARGGGGEMRFGQNAAGDRHYLVLCGGEARQNYPLLGIERVKALGYLCPRTKTAWPLATRTDRRNIMK